MLKKGNDVLVLSPSNVCASDISPIAEYGEIIKIGRKYIHIKVREKELFFEKNTLKEKNGVSKAILSGQSKEEAIDTYKKELAIEKEKKRKNDEIRLRAHYMRKLKTDKANALYKNRYFIILRDTYKYKAKLAGVEYKANSIYVWFSPRKKGDMEIFRRIDIEKDTEGVHLIDSDEIYKTFGWKINNY